jgi:hypothetical protein
MGARVDGRPGGRGGAPSPFIDESSPAALLAGLHVLAALLMALTIAALTAPLARSVFTEGRRD